VNAEITAMAISDSDVETLLAELDRSRQAWIEGRLSWTVGGTLAQAEDMTIFGPFGGEIGRADDVRQAQIAAQFHGGVGSTEVVKVVVEGDLVVVVAVERNSVTFEGDVEPRPWILRTTQVFRRHDGKWLRLHRHADPLIERRSLADTRALLPR
jgi:ketosteroid isomerase-like protein